MLTTEGVGGAHPDDGKSTSSSSSARAAANEGGEELHEFQRLAYSLKLARSLSEKFEVDADVAVPYHMISSLEEYSLWMPWCTSGCAVSPISGDRDVEHDMLYFDGRVGFGFETGTFLGTVG